MALPSHRRFACEPASAPAARAFVRESVRDHEVDLDSLDLLVSEVAANAIRHARTAFDVTVQTTSDAVAVEVFDRSSDLPVAGPKAEGGFGLRVVAAIAARWGVTPKEGGKVVWFQIPVAARSSRAGAFGLPSQAARTADELPTYSIGAASTLVGVDSSTLRAWEQRYDVVVPTRNDGGHRLFTRDQVDQLRFVVAQIATGMSAGDAHRVLRQRMGEVTFVPASPGTSMLVLVAERDQYAADLSEYFLRTEGYDVRIALDAEEAERLHQQRRPDLVILEMLLPGGAAIDLCRRIAADDVPVVAVSSLLMRDVAAEAGASAFLIKPLDPLQLVSTVQDLVGTSALATASASSDDVAAR